MKYSIFLILILILFLFLTSCTSNTDIHKPEKIIFSQSGSTFGQQYILQNIDEMLYFVDLSMGDITPYPLCSKPNCNHNKNLDTCTAHFLGTAQYPFIHNDCLYYFKRFDENKLEVGLYQSETNGTNQKLIFSSEDNFFAIHKVYFWDDILFFITSEGKPGEHGSYYSTSSNSNNRIYMYDFNKVRLIYETGLLHDGEVNLYGIIEDELYYFISGRDYAVSIPPDKYLEYVTDKDSIYWQDYNREFRRMNIKQRKPKDPDYDTIDIDFEYGIGVVFLDNSYYYYSAFDNAVNRVDISTNIKERIFTPEEREEVLTVRSLDEKIIIDTVIYDNSNIAKYDIYRYYHDGIEFINKENLNNIPMREIWFETKDYFFGFSHINDETVYAYISKTDYYNLDYNGLIEFNW